MIGDKTIGTVTTRKGWRVTAHETCPADRQMCCVGFVLLPWVGQKRGSDLLCNYHFCFKAQGILGTHLPQPASLLSGQGCCNFSVQMKSIESHRKRRGPQCLTAPGRQLACNMISGPVSFFVCCAQALSMGYWMSPGRCCGIKEANFELG